MGSNQFPDSITVLRSRRHRGLVIALKNETFVLCNKGQNTKEQNKPSLALVAQQKNRTNPFSEEH